MNISPTAPLFWPPWLLAPLVVAGIASVAQASTTSGEVEFGSGYVSDSQFKFGEYNALEDSGLYPIINFTVAQQPAWDSNISRYWSASGRDLGLDSRALTLDFGDYAHRRLRVDYREFNRNVSDSGHTVFANANASATDLRLPAGWVAATTTAGMTALDGPLAEVTEAIKRQRLSLEYQLLSAPNSWAIDLGFTHETKQGERVLYGIIGNTGGNPRAVALPSPIDYAVNELALTAHYTQARYSMQFGYRLSLFDNDHRSQSWDNPFLAIPGWNPAAGYPSGRGALALEPDNRYQQLYFQGSMRVSTSTRINGSLRYALLEQDEDYLPYTINTALAVTSPLPRDSLDGEIAIAQANLGLQQRLSPSVQLQLNAAYEDRNNRTPRDLYVYVGGDSQDQSNSASSRARYNLPYSYREEAADTSLRYRWLQATHLTASYHFRAIHRDYSEVGRSDQHRGQLSIDSRPNPKLQWRLDLSRELRESTDYRGERPFFESHTADYIATVPTDERFENHPLLRKYHLAERERDRARLRVNAVPEDHLSLGFTLSHADDDYKHSAIGLTRAKQWAAHADIGVFASEQFEWNSFFSYEQYRSDQDGRSFRGFAVVPDSQNPARDWQHESEDKVKTLGSDFTVFQVAPATDMKLGYLLAFGRSELETETGSALSSAPVPSQHNKTVRLSAEFLHRYSPRLDLILKLTHETYEATNFSTDSVEPNTVANVILLGNETPSYSVNWYQLSVKYRF